MLTRLADLSIARPRRVAAAVGAIFMLALLLGGSAGKTLSARNDFSDPGSQSAHARTTLARATGSQPTPGVLVLVRGPGAAATAAAVQRELGADPAVAHVAPPLPGSRSASLLIAATLRSPGDEHAGVESIERRLGRSHAITLGGSSVGGLQVGRQASADLGLAEALAFPLLAILAFLIFRGIAALLPLAVGALSVFTAFAALRGIDTALPLSVFALNLVIGLGLGLAVDYSLFMVSRYREEIGAGRDPAGAVRVTMRTAGRTVLFSAVTVAIAMSSLTVFPLRFLQSMGIGGAVVALTAAASSLTLLPALFVIFGERLGRSVPGPVRQGRWYALAHWVLRRPGPVAAITVLALLAMAMPAVRAHWSGVDPRVLPASAGARQVEDALAREYPAVGAIPSYAAISAPAGDGAAVAAYAGRLRALPGVADVGAPRLLGPSTWSLTFTTSGEAIAGGAQRAIARARALAAPFPVLIGGWGAEFKDQRAAIARSLPLALLILVAGTLLALWLMTGSVILPVKALVMNALTVGAATGLLVLIFQDGRLTGPLGYTPQAGIEQSDYLVLAAIAFALSTDYGVFLLTRIKEARDRGADDREAIALGLQRTGRIVTAAAVLLAVAIGAFATSSVIFLKEIGVGAVAAVLIDAFIVRALLVPALMGLLGPWNWWSPAPLRRLHARLAFDESGPQPPSGGDRGPAPSAA